jgi:hypothetical protein
MTGATLLRSVVAALDESGVPFMLTGSLAAAFYGPAEPRWTSTW